MSENNTHSDEYSVRLKKLENIKEAGINPYPASFDKQNPVIEIQDSDDGVKLKTAGRLMTIREMGKLVFCHLQDESGKAQVSLKSDEIDKEKFDFFLKNIDMGDFVGVEGEVFTTQKGEKTLLVKEYTLLSKAILPLPEKWHGIKDEEGRLRKRYLDILTDPEKKDLLTKKMFFWHSMREFLISKGFTEVETPVLETTTGGADARPFSTHHNALDIDVFLRISMGELWQKKLMVAGFDKTFEIGRQFRNEGMDAEHLQDYTQMEYYFGYADWNDGMKLTEELVKYVAEKTFGTLKFNIKGQEIDLSKKWEKYDYKEEILNNTSIDIEKTTVEEIKSKLQELKVKYDDFNNLERGIDQLWKHCRKQIVGPGYLIYPPKIISPLAKESPERPGYTERYQLILAGSELCNGYSELNDPIDQEERFKKQTELREAGDEEAQMYDEEFVEALKHGMPPTTGLGISERLFSFLADKTLRECQFFPLVRPKVNNISQAGDNKELDLGIDLKAAEALVDKYIVDNVTKLHLIESQAIMQGLARHLDEDEEKWGILGLLHDIDWDLTKDDTSQHCIKAVDILKEAGVSEQAINIIQAHCYGQGSDSFIGPEDLKDKKRTTKVEHALAAAEILTGLIVASALMQPDKKLASVKLSSLKKKFKSKSFAANCNREIMKECEKIGLSIDGFLEIGLKSMQNISDKLGL